jgi:hypothetical protein
MKTFKIFSGQLDELTGVAPKAKGEHKFVHTTYMAQVKDPGDLEKVGPEEVGPADTKSGQGKRPADRLDNKQKFAESKYEDDETPEDEKKEKKTLKGFKESLAGKTTLKHINKPNPAEKKAAKDVKSYADRVALLKAAKDRGALKEEDETLLTKLFDQLDESNQELFLTQLEEDAELLLAFAKELVE